MIEPVDFIGVATMRQVGKKRERPMAFSASGHLLAEGARFNEAISRLSQSSFVPKGIYRFRSHEAANQHAEDCLVRGMGRLVVARSNNG
jgi:hypothetical protein